MMLAGSILRLFRLSKMRYIRRKKDEKV